MSMALYTCKTVYDEAAYTALVQLMMKKLRRWPRRIILLTGFVSMMGAAAMMFMQGASLIGTVFLIAGNLMCMFGLFAPRIAVRMMMASNKKGEVPSSEYAFGEDEVQIRTAQAQKAYSYGFFRRILEMSGYLFFFMQDEQIYLLKTSDMPDYKAFRTFLDEHVLASRKKKEAKK